MDEQLDDVKRMNQMMLYAQCVSIRDKQVDEKKQMRVQEKEEERRLDNIMEVDRQRAVREAEVRLCAFRAVLRKRESTGSRKKDRRK